MSSRRPFRTLSLLLSLLVLLLGGVACQGADSSPTLSPEELAERRAILLQLEATGPAATAKAQATSSATAAQAGAPVVAPLARYRLRAQKLDLEAVGGYPQQIARTLSAEPPYELEIAILPQEERLHTVPLQPYDYPVEVAAYLQPSTYIESDDPAVCALAQEVTADETDVVGVARAAAEWTARNIAYDEELAQQIWQGKVDTQSAATTLERRAGTCSEYANLFIAMMRCRGIPARFVSGYVYRGMYHAWAEVYLQGVGWLPVDAQGALLGTSERHVKLFSGRDFGDLGVKLQEIGVSLERLPG